MARSPPGGYLHLAMRQEIRFAGFGGQGIVSAGRIAGQGAVIYDGKHSALTQSFGPEARGGASRIVTTCPLCQFNLEERFPPEAPALPVLYLGQLLAWAMGAGEPAVAALLTGEPATGEPVSKGV